MRARKGGGAAITEVGGRAPQVTHYYGAKLGSMPDGVLLYVKDDVGRGGDQIAAQVEQVGR